MLRLFHKNGHVIINVTIIRARCCSHVDAKGPHLITRVEYGDDGRSSVEDIYHRLFIVVEIKRRNRVLINGKHFVLVLSGQGGGRL